MIKYFLILMLIFISYNVLTMNVGKIIKKDFSFNFRSELIIIIISFLSYFSSIDNLLFIKLFVSILSLFTISFLIYKENQGSSFSSAVVYLIITLVSELVIMLIFKLFTQLNTDYVISASILKGCVTLSTEILTFVLLRIIAVQELIRKLYELLKSKKDTVNYIFILVISTVIVFIVYILYFYDNSNIFITILFYISCTFIIISSIYTMDKNNNLIYLNKILEDNEKALLQSLNNYKMFKHNVKHEFSCIKSLGNKKVNQLIDEYMSEYKDDFTYQNILNLPLGIKSIIYQKLVGLNSKNIDIKVDNYLNDDLINQLSTRKYCKLCQCFGIAFDNAYEGSLNTKNPYVYILLSEDNNSIRIRIVNNMHGSINIDKLGVENSTTKSHHMGVGLKYMFLNNSAVHVKNMIVNENYIVCLTVKKL